MASVVRFLLRGLPFSLQHGPTENETLPLFSEHLRVDLPASLCGINVPFQLRYRTVMLGLICGSMLPVQKASFSLTNILFLNSGIVRMTQFHYKLRLV